MSKENGKTNSWSQDQDSELYFWKNTWPYRHLPHEQIVNGIRLQDAKWFLNSFGFAAVAEACGAVSSNTYVGFRGDVLEVGCGPVGFFEAICGVSVTGIDTLMDRYAEELPYSEAGKINNYEYSSLDLIDVNRQYDFVVCSNVLDHTGDWLSFLAALIKPVKKSGSLLLYTHCRNEPSVGHSQVFDPSDLLKALLNLGVNHFDLFRILPDESAHADYQCFIKVRVS